MKAPEWLTRQRFAVQLPGGQERTFRTVGAAVRWILHHRHELSAPADYPWTVLKIPTRVCYPDEVPRWYAHLYHLWRRRRCRRGGHDMDCPPYCSHCGGRP